jgi:hypothetical protein
LKKFSTTEHGGRDKKRRGLLSAYNYFDFVPYHYGCYSFQAAHDLEILEKTGWIRTTKNDIQLQQSVDRDGFTKKGEKAEIRRFFNEHKRLRGTRLIKYVYERFPYYATKSKIAYQIMDKPPALEKYGDGETLYTLGYEGRSFEAFVNRLIKNGINVLCDVRKNPLSRNLDSLRGSWHDCCLASISAIYTSLNLVLYQVKE